MANDVGVLITGGGTGIGLAIARRFVKAGHPVYSLSRSARPSIDDLSELAKTSNGVPPRHLRVDVTKREELEAARDELAGDGVRLQVVVADAGVNIREEALTVPDLAIRNMIETNVYGVIATFQVFAPMVLRNRPSRFIAIGSVAGHYGMPLRSTYGATKAALSGLVRSLTVEWSPLGATVNAIAPGIIDTPLTEAYIANYPEKGQAVIENTPVGRFGTPEDVANVVEFLASEESGFITGQTVLVDGGLSVGCSWW